MPKNIKLLIPRRFTPKIIGVGITLENVGGNTLQEISNLSGGVRIIIPSDKYEEHTEEEIVIILEGGANKKAKAAVIIAEKIAEFLYAERVSTLPSFNSLQTANLSKLKSSMIIQYKKGEVYREVGD